jgi:hypothetical protein
MCSANLLYALEQVDCQNSYSNSSSKRINAWYVSHLSAYMSQNLNGQWLVSLHVAECLRPMAWALCVPLTLGGLAVCK